MNCLQQLDVVFALVVTFRAKKQSRLQQPQRAAESDRGFSQAVRFLSPLGSSAFRPKRTSSTEKTSRRFVFFLFCLIRNPSSNTHVVARLCSKYAFRGSRERRSREGHMLLSLPTRSSLLNTTTTRRTTFCDAARSRVQHPASSQTRRVPRVVLPTTRRVVASGRELASRFVVARAEFDGNRGQEKARGGGDGDDSLVQVRSPHHAFPFSRCRSR